MGCKELLLIGTVHGDPEGLERLLTLLKMEKPIHIAVEISPYGLFYRKRNGSLLKATLTRRIRRLERQTGVPLRAREEITSIREKFSTPFEYRAAVRYCIGSKANFHAIDLSNLSRDLIESCWKKLISTDNLKTLLNYPSKNDLSSILQEYLLAERLLKEKEGSLINTLLAPLGSEPIYAEREAHLERALLDLYKKIETGCFVYVGGWQHLLHTGHFQTLFQRLLPFKPRRILLPHGQKTASTC